MMVHQDGSRHEWVAGSKWDLIVTMDDATGEHLSMFFVEEEGTASSFQGVAETIERYGLFASLYTDRGSHYWLTPQAGIDMIAAYSPQAQGRSERAFSTHQERLPKELAKARIRSLGAANRYLQEHYRGAFNAEFAVPAAEPGSAFVPFIGADLPDILCEHFERVVGADNCVRFEGLVLQIPADRHRCHYVKASKRRFGCIATRIRAWRSSTGRAPWRAMTTRVGRLQNRFRPPREVRFASARRRTPSGYALRRSPATEKADNSCATKPDSSICS